MRIPAATYRVQLNREFTFLDAAAIVPYLSELGVSDLYTSPSLEARPGSLHGYDIYDHGHLNPELGGTHGHDALARALAENRMGHVLDIVPNHMGIGEPGNSWWMDVLENGPSSPFAPFFDIDWTPLKPELTGKVLLPVLGDQFGRILEKGELRLEFDDGRFRIRYGNQLFPVSPRSSSTVLRAVVARMARRMSEPEDDLIELESIVTALEHLPPRFHTDSRSVAERRRESFVSRRRLRILHENSPCFREALRDSVEALNGRVGVPESFDVMERVLDDQAYRLAYWRVAAEEINYRRFFDVNELAGIRVERPDVFQATHRLVLQLLAAGKISGLRVDHPDGLYDPAGYLRDLRDAAASHTGGEPVYTVVEKILIGDERIPRDWPVAGTVGYDFLGHINALFVAKRNERAMTAVYERFIGTRLHYPTLVYERKKLILRVALASELNVLAHLLNRISEKNRRLRDFTLSSLTDALREAIACFPIYRTYVDVRTGRVGGMDAEYIEEAIRLAVRRNRARSESIFAFIRDILLLRWPDDLDDEAREEHSLFVMKFQQLTGPVMAKGVEDTSFYIYNRLVSLNEVGCEPDRFGISLHECHQWLRERGASWPLSMNTSTTHDSKRSEDVRARISVLSEIPEEWSDRASRWAGMNAPRKRIVDGDPVPDANDEYLLYQVLLGAWPLDTGNADRNREFRERIIGYMAKATNEAKVHTSWINPNEAYNDALRDFIAGILDFQDGWRDRDGFLADFTSFQTGIAFDGMLNSLSQLLIKLTAPGIPDIYQGQDIWDFSLVDPDNRRPVDYEARRALLTALRGSQADPERRKRLPGEVLREWRDGRIKMLVTIVGLELRRALPDLFLAGEYLPLEVQGDRAAHLFAFARRHPSGTIIVAVPRLPRTFTLTAGAPPTDPAAWGDTLLSGPREALSGSFQNLFTGADVRADGCIAAGEALDGFPVALLRG